MIKKITIALTLFLVSCASSNCILKSDKKSTLNKKLRDAFTPEDNKDRVFVYKFDGGKQCGLGRVLLLKEMAKEFKGIKIHSSHKKNDGLLRVQVCGAPTGNANIYEVDKVNLEKVKKLGYKVWSGPRVEN